MVAVMFCTETSHVNYSVSNQHWTSSRSLYNESNAQNKFTFKCWSCHAFNVVHQLSSFFALCFAIFADEVVLSIFVLQTFSWNHSRIHFVCSPLSSLQPFLSNTGHFLILKHFEASASLCVVNGTLLDIARNLWHSLVLQSQISNFPDSLTRSVSCMHGRNFVLKCWGDSLVWNQYNHLVYAEVTFYIEIPNLISRCVLRATLITLCPCKCFTY